MATTDEMTRFYVKDGGRQYRVVDHNRRLPDKPCPSRAVAVECAARRNSCEAFGHVFGDSELCERCDLSTDPFVFAA
jgi:hypothetical protein